MAQLSSSYCDGLFNGGNCPSCSIVGAGNEFVHDPNPFPYDNTPNFYDHHHNTMSRHTRASYVGTILTMVMIFHHGYRLSMSRNHAIIKTLVANLNTHTPEPSRRFNFICFDDDDDDDDEESTIPLNEIVSQIPSSIAITPVLLTVEPKDSLIMGDEDLSTIIKKESNDVTKSSVEDLVQIPSEFEDTSGSDSECDLPSCDDFSPIDIPEGKSVTFSNPLFDSNDDFTSSDDESLFDEDVPKDNVLEDIESKASYDSNLDEPALLVTPLFDSNEDECFNQGGDVDEINAFDIPSDYKDGYYDSEGDVLYLESFLSDDTTPNLPPKVFLDHDPTSLKIPYGESKVHIEVLSVLWRNRLPIPDGSQPLSR
uniref:Reverse transcriptase domain-containing protein n=1 Tax=Tanacetum cinerariifolium TaxID=118510 RepID=A0A6L2KHU4_TANCI|nr:hypothetical protein [Tanacetum cinerariifolium]